MITNKDRLILEAYQGIDNQKDKLQIMAESFWDNIYNKSLLITEAKEEKQFLIEMEDKLIRQALWLTEAELPRFFEVLEEGWKDKLKAIGGALKKGVDKVKKVALDQASDENSAFNKAGKGFKKATNKVAGAVIKGAGKVAKASGKAAVAFAKEVIPDDWQKKGAEVIAKVKAKLGAVYDQKIKPKLMEFGNMAKKAGNILIPPEAVQAIVDNAKNNPTMKKLLGKMGTDGEKTIGNYMSQVLKDNKGSLLAAVAALAFPPASMAVGIKIAATVLIPIIFDGMIAYQSFKDDQVKAAEKQGAKIYSEFEAMKKEGKLKNVKPPKELGIGQPNMVTA